MTPTALSLLIAASTVTVPAQAPEGAFEPPPMVRHQLEEAASKQAAWEAFQRAHGVEAKANWAGVLPPATFDVTSYELDLHVDPDRRVLSGSVTVDLTAVEDGLSTVVLDADLGLRILSVLDLGDDGYAYDTPKTLVFEHAGDALTITLARPLAAGSTARLQITYGGRASRTGLIGSTGVNWLANGGTPVIHTFAQPYGARVWWPCNDRPDDKALVDLRVTVPEGLDVACNGLERSYADNGDGTSTSVWSSKYPVPTYLVVMHISDFAYSESTYTGLDGTTMPVGLWAMPQVAAQAEADLAVCVPQMEVMAGHWGEYPFLDEKFGNATVFFGGGMEHQTLTTLSVYYVGDPWMQWLNVHEMGHEWWGDWVTMDDWRHIWLNEGFATHTEWLWAEHLGPEVLADYLEDDDYRGYFNGPVYDNPSPFSWTIYAKGSWVLWMLRHVIGDEAFFSAVADYRAANAGATATTDELQAALEASSGMDLDWFFDEWVYGLYRPRYVYEWEAVEGPAVELTVRQVQTNTGLFRMPMTVRVTTAAGDEDHTVWVEDEADQTISVPTSQPALDVVLNPDKGVLADIAHVSQPDLELGPDWPDGYDFGIVPGTASATRELPLTNPSGVDLVIDEIESDSNTVFQLTGLPELPFTIAPGETRTLEIVFDPAGYGRSANTFYFHSNDPDRDGWASVPTSGTGSLYDDAYLVVPASRAVGRVPVGGTGQTTFNAINLGGQPLPVQTTVTGEGFFLAQTVPPVLPPGSSTEISVRFHPVLVGAAEGSVIFHQGDPGDPLGTVRLTSTADGAPRLSLDRHALSLGVGDDASVGTIWAGNTGSETLEISRLAVEPPFVLVEPSSGSASVPTGAAVGIVIGLEDPETGVASSHLAIHSNDPAVPVVRVPLRAFVSDDAPALASFTAASRTVGLGDVTWSTRAYLLNPTDDPIRTDLVFRPGYERGDFVSSVGIEIPPRSQRVIPDLVAATADTQDSYVAFPDVSGTGGVNLRSSAEGLIAAARIFAAGSGGTFGQLAAAHDHDDALVGSGRYLLAGLSGNDGFHTNIGVLNLGDTILQVDVRFFSSSGYALGTRRVTAQPEAFKQVVAVIGKLTGETVRGGYATLSAVDPDARYLAYGSVVDDATSDPTLALPQALDGGETGDLIIQSVASVAGAAGTMWESVFDVVNTGDEARTVRIEYHPDAPGPVPFMEFDLAAGTSQRFDGIGDAIPGAEGKGWLRISASGPDVFATSRTYNDDPSGTYGQLIPALPADLAAGPEQTVVLPGLSSIDGFRTNIGLTSLTDVDLLCTLECFTGDGASIGEPLSVALAAHGFTQVERVLSEGLGFSGEAWATIRCSDPEAAFFAHASVVDGNTGDPTFITGKVLDETR